MAEAKAQLNSVRIAPRKVRVVADLVRGKTVEVAMRSLSFANKKAALPLEKLIKSAVANARSQDISADNLKIKEIRVEGGGVLKRSNPVAFGRAHPIKKRTSHVRLVLETGDEVQKAKSKKPKKEKPTNI